MQRHLIAIILCFTGDLALADFDPNADLISLHYDHAPDRDDGHAAVSALMVVQDFNLSPHVVSGTYGTLNASRYVAQSEALMNTVWQSRWLNAHTKRANAIDKTVDRWASTLAAGGEVWVAEGGQSDVTAAVTRRLQSDGFDTQSSIHVVQHSVWNEDHTNPVDLRYVKNNTDYIRIDDGNGNNRSANLKSVSNHQAFIDRVLSTDFSSQWRAAFAYLNPDNKLDFSDTVELLHILDINKSEVANPLQFANRFAGSTAEQPVSPTIWSDSYSVGGQCYCDSSFDHGIASRTIDTPVGAKTIPEICGDITSEFGSGSVDNRIYYNTVQCGHPPMNNAADETSCPGIPIAAGNYTGGRCQQTGATWNLDILYASANQPPESGSQTVVRIEAENFVSKHPDWRLTSTTSTPGINPDPDVSHAGSASSRAYMELLPDTRVTHSDRLVNGGNFWNTAGTGPSLSYNVNIPEAGRYIVFVKAYSTGTEDNGIHVGLNNTNPVSGHRMQWCTGKNKWTWSSAQRVSSNHCGTEGTIYLDFSVAGANTVTFSAREDGFEFDQFILLKTSNDSCAPDDNDQIACDTGTISISAQTATTTLAATSAATLTPAVPQPLEAVPSINQVAVDSADDTIEEDLIVSEGVDEGSAYPEGVLHVDANRGLVEYGVRIHNCIFIDSDTDGDGDGYGWEQRASCIMSGSGIVTVVTFPVCSSALVDVDGDGWGWENAEPCLVLN